jgi:MFS transporter, DHA2 family, multidrug resistance protein
LNASLSPAAPDGLPTPRRYWAIAAIVLAVSMASLDVAIANVALPSIAKDFRATTAASIWVINAYQISILVSLLPLASLGESIGCRRMWQFGLVVFTAASLACARADSLFSLSIARVVQGLGAAALFSVYGALVRFTYPSAKLGRAISINTLAIALCSVIGPTLASAILAVSDWRWLFAVNVPIGIVTVAIGARALPVPARSGRSFNLPGAMLNVATFGLLICGLQGMAQDSGSGFAVAEIGVGALVGGFFVRYELAQPDPLLPLDLLQSRRFSLSILTSVTCFIGISAALVSLPFEIQRLGHSAAETGLLMTPWPAAICIVAPLAGRLSDRYPAEIMGGIGLAVFGCGLLCLAIYPAGGSAADFLWRMAVCGVGLSLFQTPNNRHILSSAPKARSGAAGALQGAARGLGQSLGAAGVAILFRFLPVTGSNVALKGAAAMALAAALISLARLRTKAQS